MKNNEMKRMWRRIFALCLFIVTVCSVTALADDFSIITPITPNVMDFENSNIQDWTAHWNVTYAKNYEFQPATESSDGAYCYTGTYGDNATWGFRLFTPGNNDKTSLHNPVWGVAELSFDLMFSSTYYDTSTTDGPVVSLKNTDGKDLLAMRLRSFNGVSRISLTDSAGTPVLDVRILYDTWYTYNIKVNIPKGTYTLTITKKGETTAAETKTGNLIPQNTKNLYCLNILALAADTEAKTKVYIDNYSVKRESFIVGTPEISLNESGATATVKVANETSVQIKTPQLIVALYDENDRLLNVNCQSILIEGRLAGSITSAVDGEIECSVTTPADKNVAYARAFVWNSIEGLKPYITPVEVSLGE